jgi:hypothetical protein
LSKPYKPTYSLLPCRHLLTPADCRRRSRSNSVYVSSLYYCVLIIEFGTITKHKQNSTLTYVDSRPELKGVDKEALEQICAWVHAGVEVKKQEGQGRAGKRGTCRGRGRETGSCSRAKVWIAVSTRVLILKRLRAH